VEMWILLLVIIAGLAVLAGLVGWANNGAQWGNRLANWVDGLSRFMCRFYHGLPADTLQLPEGPCIVISNHISGLDPFLLIAATHRPLRFIIAREEYQRFGLTWLFKAAGCIPVDRKGRVESAFREALRQLALGEAVALFPHGKIHLDGESYRPLKRGVFRLAELAQVPVVCARLSGVRAQGTVLFSVLLPSAANVEQLESMPAGTEFTAALREQLGHRLCGRYAANTTTEQNLSESHHRRAEP